MPAGHANDPTFQRAMAALQAGNSKDAEQFLRAVLRAQPRHVAALNVLGIVLTQQREFSEAETYLRRAVRENPRSDATLYNYGLVLKALKRPAEAIERFSAALAINPAVAETWNNRGTAFNDLGRHDEAIVINADHVWSRDHIPLRCSALPLQNLCELLRDSGQRTAITLAR